LSQSFNKDYLMLSSKQFVGAKMEMNEYLLNLVNCQKMLHNDILNNDSFGQDELEEINCKMSELMEQLAFWAEQDNQFRFGYELKNHIQWIIKNYS